MEKLGSLGIQLGRFSMDSPTGQKAPVMGYMVKIVVWFCSDFRANTDFKERL